jgi:predicted PhzF superfamily epimerase YddE/YHI9
MRNLWSPPSLASLRAGREGGRGVRSKAWKAAAVTGADLSEKVRLHGQEHIHMGQSIMQVDAFTDRPFAGNSAVDSEESLRNLQPDFALLSALTTCGVIVIGVYRVSNVGAGRRGAHEAVRRERVLLGGQAVTVLRGELVAE